MNPEQTDRDIEVLALRVAHHLFGVFGHTDDEAGNRVVRFGGSGLFVAPFQGLTARHVLVDLHRTDKYRADELLRRTSGFFVPPHSMCVFQVVEAFGNEQKRVAIFHVRRSWNLTTTDISLIEAAPDDSVSTLAQMETPVRYFEWSLAPPPVGSTVLMFGFPKTTITALADRFNVQCQFVMQGSVVTEVFDKQRDSGLYSFPCFSVDQPIDGGFSGGPVFWDGRLCGLVSGDSFGSTYVTSLWPLCLTGYEYPDIAFLQEQSFATLFERGVLKSPDWPQIKERMSVGPDGKPFLLA